MHKSPSATTKKISSATSSKERVAVPQQLVVPIRINAWSGKAIVDTGASYTLIHESLMRHLKSPDQLHPLYLANGEAEIPLGWLNTTIHLHDQSFTLPAAVLSSQALAYAVVLGLDFIFFSGLQLNVIDQRYSFKLDPTKEYPFQPGNPSVPTSSPQKEKRPLKTTQNLSLLTSVPPLSSPLIFQQIDSVDEKTLIINSVEAAHLPFEGKQQLLQILEGRPQVCTLRTGRTEVLQHRIYTTNQVPIKQRPYRLSPTKQFALDEQLKEMLQEGIVEPSHSGPHQWSWSLKKMESSDFVLITGKLML